MMNRHENREKTVIGIYQYRVCERPLEELIDDASLDSTYQEDDYMISIFKDTIQSMPQYIEKLTPFLENWTFERIEMLEQAILLCGCCEIEKNEMDKAIIIDEYVRIAKKYCGSDSYKFINGVLDQL